MNSLTPVQIARGYCALATVVVLGSLAAGASAAETSASASLSEARTSTAAATRQAKAWEGPTTGPRAQPGKTISFIADDLRNGGVLGVAQGVREAAREIGWTVKVFDSNGTTAGMREALAEAFAARHDGLIISGADARDYRDSLAPFAARGTPVVGWHVAPKSGPVLGTPVTVNVTTDPAEVARVTALAAIAESGGKAGVVIFTDSKYGIAMAKSSMMANFIRACPGCQLLEVRDVPLSESATYMPGVTRELLAKYGSRWTHALAINDIYFDYAVPVLVVSGLPIARLSLVSAGDGSASAFLRIRANTYQTGTVAEPLNLHGWQVIDELNRLFAGQPTSQFVAPVHLVTNGNIGSDVGPDGVYDPANGYRDAYRRIWRGK